MESESKNIIQMLKNVKQMIDVSKERGCWSSDELKDIGITYHNVCEIAKQLQANQPDDKEVDESVECLEPCLDKSVEEMDEVD